MISSGSYGDPPTTRQRDYGIVLLHVLWRMRVDLVILLVIIVIVHADVIPRDWTA